MTQNPPHMIAGALLGAELARVLPAALYHARAAGPIRLPNRDSEPEPDRCVVRGTIRDYEGRHPGPGDIAIVIDGQPLGQVAVADVLPSRPATPKAEGHRA